MVVEQEMATLSMANSGGLLVLRRRDNIISVDLDALNVVFQSIAQLAKVAASETTLHVPGAAAFSWQQSQLRSYSYVSSANVAVDDFTRRGRSEK